MARQRKLKPFDLTDFVNEIGQTVKVGDDVVIVTHCTGSVGIGKGRYAGRRGDDDNVRVLCEVDESHRKLVHKDTGAEYDYSTNGGHPEITRPVYPSRNIFSSSPRDYWSRLTPEQEVAYQAAYKKYQEDYKVYQELVEETKKDYEFRDFPYVRITNLYLNRIFPIATALTNLIGQRF